jgi:hypothetical protein
VDILDRQAGANSRTHAAQQTTQMIASLFDHVVGQCQQLVGDFEAERPRGLEIDHQLEFGGLDDRQVSRFFPLRAV